MKSFKAIMAILTLGVLFGCASTGTLLTQEQINQLKIGETTYDQAVAILGEPQDIDLDAEGNRILVYIHQKSTAKAVNFVPILGSFAGGVDTETSKTKLIFGKDGVLKDVFSRLKMQDDVKTGIISK